MSVLESGSNHSSCYRGNLKVFGMSIGKDDKEYDMSFSTGGLFRLESGKLAALYQQFRDWQDVRGHAMAHNVLQTRIQSTAKRLLWEVISRLQTLNVAELDLLTDAKTDEKSLFLWIAVCRRYRFIAEFALEVMREKMNSGTPLLNEDFDAYFSHKSEWNERLEAIRPTTRMKLRQVLFRMLHEAEFLDTMNQVVSVLPSQRLVTVLYHEHRNDLLFLPILESDLIRIRDEFRSQQ